MNEFLNENKTVIRKSLNAIFLVLILGAVFLAALSISALKEYTYIGRDVPAYNTISVEGEGESFMAPDTALFTFSVTREAGNVSEAQTQVSERIDEVLTGLGVFNIDEKDIKTVNYNAYPRYEYGVQPVIAELGVATSFPRSNQRQLVGYEVSQTISVKVRDISKLSEVVQRLGELNVDNLNGPNLTIDDEDELIADARDAAIADAEEKAKSIAKALGVRLVRVVNFSEWGGPSYGYGGEFALAREESFDSAPKVEIPTGENKATVTVNISYEIK